MRKYLNARVVVAAAGFTAGYILGRNYDITIALKKVTKDA